MRFHVALVLSLILHVIVLFVAYFVHKPEQPTPPEPYLVRMVSPDEIAPQPAAPSPMPEGAPVEPTPPVPPSEPARPVPPAPGPENVPGETSPAPTEPAPVSPAPDTGPVRPGPPALPPGGLPRPGDVKDIIDQIAKAPTPEEEAESPGITFSVHEFRQRTYMQRLKEKIEGVWSYPRGASEKGIYGDLYIRFTILRDGSLGEVKVVRTSGYADLDQAALKALRDGAPYWPIPDGWPERSLTITGHFIYTLYGGYLR